LWRQRKVIFFFQLCHFSTVHETHKIHQECIKDVKDILFKKKKNNR
jgi:hypothetical protein